MGLRFRVRNQLINIQRIVPHRFRQRQSINDMCNIIHGTMHMRMCMITMVLMVVIMVMLMMVVMIMVVVVVIVLMVMIIVVMIMVMIVIVLMIMVMDVFMFMVMIVVVVVMMVMNFLLLTIHDNTEMRSDDTAFHGWFNRKANAWQTDCIHLVDERILVVKKLIQGSSDHVARRAHSAIQIKRSHCLSPYHSKNYAFRFKL